MIEIQTYDDFLNEGMLLNYEARDKNIVVSIDNDVSEGKFIESQDTHIETSATSYWSDTPIRYTNSDTNQKLLVLEYIFQAGKNGRTKQDILRFWMEEVRGIKYDPKSHSGQGGFFFYADGWMGKPMGIFKAHCTKNSNKKWVLTDDALIKAFNVKLHPEWNDDMLDTWMQVAIPGGNKLDEASRAKHQYATFTTNQGVTSKERLFTKQLKMLYYIWEGGEEGRKRTEISRHIVEKIQKRTYDPKSDRGYYQEHFKKGINYWSGKPGMIERYCIRNGMKYVVNNPSLIEYFEGLNKTEQKVMSAWDISSDMDDDLRDRLEEIT